MDRSAQLAAVHAKLKQSKLEGFGAKRTARKQTGGRASESCRGGLYLLMLDLDLKPRLMKHLGYSSRNSTEVKVFV